MCNKVYSAVVLLIAIGLAVLVSNVSIDNVDRVMLIIKFFDAMIPVLAVGALFKYIWSGGSKKCACCGTSCAKCSSTVDSTSTATTASK